MSERAFRVPAPGIDGAAAAKAAAARAAVAFVVPGSVIGVGTGTTTAAFVEALARSGRRPAAAVASSRATAHLLRESGIEVVPLPPSGRLPLYVDGADAVDPAFRLLKGGGGAQTREKVLATASDLFMCIVDDNKPVAALSSGVVCVEVLPMAAPFVECEIERMGGAARLRDGFETDNGNGVLDISGLDLTDPLALECALECLPGVVGCGVFARRPADVVLIGHADGSVDRRDRRT